MVAQTTVAILSGIVLLTVFALVAVYAGRRSTEGAGRGASTARGPGRRWPIPPWLSLCMLGAVALIWLWRDHPEHIFRVLPYLLLLACPLIHLFMHRGHGHGGGNPGGTENEDHHHSTAGRRP